MFMLEPTNKYTHPSYLPFFPISFPQLSSKGILLKWIALTKVYLHLKSLCGRSRQVLL